MSDIYSILDSLGVAYGRYDHPAVFTCEEAVIHCAGIPGGVCKNLFLRNRKGNRHFLVVIPSEEKADFTQLESLLGEKIGFASPERLLQFLGVTPGSATLLGLINDHDKQVEVIIDERLWACDELQMHPLVNTASLVIKHDDVKKFLDWRGNRLRIEKL